MSGVLPDNIFLHGIELKKWMSCARGWLPKYPNFPMQKYVVAFGKRTKDLYVREADGELRRKQVQ